MAKPTQYRIAIVGSGNWGSAIAKVIGRNLAAQTAGIRKFEKSVKMWVYEEEIHGRKLSEIINQDHENVKYLPGIKLPENIIAEPDLVKTVQGADLLLFVIPHQFINDICQKLRGKVKKTAIALTLIKGIVNPEPGKIELLSDVIHKALGIEVGALMGANIANEVALEKFCETTIAFKNMKYGHIFAEAIQTPDFQVTVIDDVTNTELAGAIKNIVSFAAGLVDGLYGDGGGNTKAAVVRLGMMEMIHFSEKFFLGGRRETFLESCGIADLITSSYGGRNRKVAMEMVLQPNKTLQQLENEMLHGQKLQGPGTAEEVYTFLKQKHCENDFPIFTAVHRICQREIPPSALIDNLRQHYIRDS